MRITIWGATGLIGTALTRALIERGDQVTVLARNRPPDEPGRPAVLVWDPASGPPPSQAIEGADAIVNLAGEPIADRRWTTARKARMRESRLIGTRGLVDGIARAGARPAVLVSASAIGYYGQRGDELLDETSTSGDDFLAALCRDWEAEANRFAALGLRVVTARTGIVLAPDGGALPKLALPFRLFVGGRLADGRQWMSWIHLRDEVGLLQHALSTPSVVGPMNLVAPEPVRNAVMAREIGRALHRPALLPAPRLALRLALGERVDVLLASQRVRPSVAERTGYHFAFPSLGPALDDLLREPPT